MIHPFAVLPSSLRVPPIARMMHHDLVIRVLHRAGCGRVLPHARADCRTYVCLKCAVYLDRRWGSMVVASSQYARSPSSRCANPLQSHWSRRLVSHVFCERLALPQANGGAIALLAASTANINNCKFDGSTAVGSRKTSQAHSDSARVYDEDVRESRNTHLRPYSESCPLHA